MQSNIHQIWVGPYRIPLREQGYVVKMKEKHPGFTHFLWTDENRPLMPPDLEERYQIRINQKEYAFASDILRVFVVHLYGGLYFDIDTDTERGLHGISVDCLDGAFRHHENSDPTISNDFIGLSAGHPLGAYLLSLMKAPAYDFGPHWLGYSVKDYLNINRNALHKDTRQALASINMLYMPSNKQNTYGEDLDIWEGRFHNRALFSWSDENKIMFSQGNYL